MNEARSIIGYRILKRRRAVSLDFARQFVDLPVANVSDGMVIEPGDLMLGDDDGILAVRQDEAAQLLEATRAKQAAEVKMIAEIAAGAYSAEWIDQALQRGTCFIEA